MTVALMYVIMILYIFVLSAKDIVDEWMLVIYLCGTWWLWLSTIQCRGTSLFICWTPSGDLNVTTRRGFSSRSSRDWMYCIFAKASDYCVLEQRTNAWVSIDSVVIVFNRSTW